MGSMRGGNFRSTTNLPGLGGHIWGGACPTGDWVESRWVDSLIMRVLGASVNLVKKRELGVVLLACHRDQLGSEH